MFGWLFKNYVDPCQHVFGRWRANIYFQRRKCKKCGFTQEQYVDLIQISEDK